MPAAQPRARYRVGIGGNRSCCHKELDSHSSVSILQDAAFPWDGTSEEFS